MNSYPWELCDQDKRSINTIVTYIIFCEDRYHEPAYFNSFSIENKLIINIIPGQGQHSHNYYNAIKKCESDGLLEIVNGSYRIKQDVTENIWCVYDRDLNLGQLNTADKDNFQFNLAIKNAKDAGIKVAWSNDVFELWILLHLGEVAKGNNLFRKEIYARLTEIFLQLSNTYNELAFIRDIPSCRYEKHIKPKFSRLIPILREKVDIAIARSQMLASQFDDNVLFHDRNPCTMVHHLVMELLEFHKD